MSTGGGLDFRVLFESIPEPFLVLAPDFTNVAVSDAFLRATMTKRDAILGRSVFDVVPGNPDDPASSIQSLRASLEQAARERQAHTMATQKRRFGGPATEDGVREERYWRPSNTPILGPHREVRYIIHRLEDITEQTRARVELNKLTQLEQLVMRLSSDMINIVPERVDAGVNGALADIGTFAGVDRSYVFMFDKTGARVSNTHEWCAAGIEPEIHRLQDLPVRDYPWLIRQLQGGEVVHVPRVSDLPEEARAEREEWQFESIRSILLVPMKASGRVAGYVGLDAVRTEKTWPREFIFLLRVLGEIVLNALTRKAADAALREHRVLSIERSSDAVLLSDSSGRFVHVNDAASELTGYSRDELLTMPREQIVSPDDRSRFGPVLARLAAGQIVREEWRLLRKNGSIVLVEATARRLADGRVQVLARDITERKRILQAVTEDRRTLATLMDNLPGMVYRCKPGPGWIPQFVSAGVLPLTGYRIDQLIGPNATATPETMIHPQDLARVRREIDQANAEARQYTVEYRLITAAGDEKWVWERGTALRGPVGEVAAIEGFITDITPRKRAEQALALSLAQLDAAQERAHLGSWEHDPVTGAGFWSREMYRIFERDTAQGAPAFDEFLSLLDPAQRPEMLGLRKWALEGAEAVSGDFRLNLASGVERYVNATLQGVRDEHGQGLRLAGTMLDITDRRRAADQVRRSEQFKSAVLEVALDGIVAIDHEGKIVEFNPAAEAMFQFSRDQALGKHMVDLVVPPRLRDAHRRGFAHFLATGEGPILGKRLELEALRADGTEFPVELAIVAIGASSKPMFTSFLRDISDRKRAERMLQEANVVLERRVAERTRELQQAKEHAETADRMKSEFLANMSHELRTPLNAIIGFTGTLLMKLPGALNAQQEQQLDIVQASARHLLSLINDLLDLAKIESGKMQVKVEPVACRAMMVEIAEMLRPEAARKGVALEFEPPRDEVRVSTDARALKQIVLNLCNNAIKFTDAGSVVLELRMREGRELEIGVTDSGVGIRSEDQQRLFQAFAQADSVHREGTGLGLHLSRKLAQLIRGTIQFSSEYGKGSRFWLTVPLE